MRSAQDTPHRYPPAIRWLSYLLFVTLLATCFGPFCSFLINKARIQQAMESRIEEILPDSILIAFYLPESGSGDFHWTRKGKEFTYHDEMYDVVRTRLENGRKVLLCLRDTMERKLVKDYAKRETDNRNPVKHIRNLNISWINSTISYIYLITATPVQYVTLSDNFISEVTEILSPPPEEDFIHQLNTAS